MKTFYFLVLCFASASLAGVSGTRRVHDSLSAAEFVDTLAPLTSKAKSPRVSLAKSRAPNAATVVKSGGQLKAMPAGSLPSFSFERKMDTGEIKGRRVIVPGATLLTWADSTGKPVTWDAETGVVTSGDTVITFTAFRRSTEFWFARLQESAAARRVYDSAASDNLAKAWAILNPRPQ